MSLIAAEATGVTKLEPAHRKIYVLDTNVLLHDPTAITAFAEHQVVDVGTLREPLLGWLKSLPALAAARPGPEPQ